VPCGRAFRYQSIVNSRLLEYRAVDRIIFALGSYGPGAAIVFLAVAAIASSLLLEDNVVGRASPPSPLGNRSSPEGVGAAASMSRWPPLDMYRALQTADHPFLELTGAPLSLPTWDDAERWKSRPSPRDDAHQLITPNW
jgi:hypothetical protein